MFQTQQFSTIDSPVTIGQADLPFANRLRRHLQTRMPSRAIYRGKRRARRVGRNNFKSSRTSTSSLGRVQTSGNVRQIWPYGNIGRGQMWDPFPKKASALLRYSQTIILDPSAATPSAYLFRANSIHDPDFTGTGHQPYGHDTYASIYNHYNVRSATITMTPTIKVDGIFGISLTDDSSVQSNYDTIRETKDTKMSVMSANSNSQTITQYYNVNRNFDLPFQKATSASFGASPSEGMIFHCWAEGGESTVDPGSTRYLITISYVVDMWELKDLGQS